MPSLRLVPPRAPADGQSRSANCCSLPVAPLASKRLSFRSLLGNRGRRSGSGDEWFGVLGGGATAGQTDASGTRKPEAIWRSRGWGEELMGVVHTRALSLAEQGFCGGRRIRRATLGIDLRRFLRGAPDFSFFLSHLEQSASLQS